MTPRRRRRRISVAVGAAVVVVLAACGGSRDRARGDLVDQLVEGGLPEEIAACVVEAFFDARDDDELREFFARDELTEDERQEFARLGEACVPDG